MAWDDEPSGVYPDSDFKTPKSEQPKNDKPRSSSRAGRSSRGYQSSPAAPTPTPASAIPTFIPYGTDRSRDMARMYGERVVRTPSGNTTKVDARTPQQAARDTLTELYGPYVDPMAGFDTSQYTRRSEAALDDFLAKQQQDFAAREAALAGMFNTGEDPAARALLNQQLADLTARGQAAQQSVNTAYSQGSDTIRQIAADIAAGAQQSATDVNDAYLNAAAQASAANRGMADAASAQFSGLGVSPQQAAALDAVALMEAQAPREAALARTLGQISSESTNRQAASMADQLAAQQSALTSAVAAAAAQASQNYTANEMAHQRSEADAYRNAVMDLWGQRSAATSAGDQRRMDIADAATQNEMNLERDRRMGQWEYDQGIKDAAVSPFVDKYLTGLTASDTSAREAKVPAITSRALVAAGTIEKEAERNLVNRNLGQVETFLTEAARQPDRAAALAKLNLLYVGDNAALLEAIIKADPTFPKNQQEALAQLGSWG